MKIDYRINAVKSYINWDYFYYAWGIHNKPAEEKQKLRNEAESMLLSCRKQYQTHAVFLLLDANSDGDDILLSNGIRLPFLRQQHGEPCLCLADYIRPQSAGQTDKIGLFATSVDIGM